MASAWIVEKLPLESIVNPLDPAPADVPSISTTGESSYPGAVWPWISTWSVIVGSADVGEIVPATLNSIVSEPSFAFASRIACRRLPQPEVAQSVRFETVYVAACAGAAPTTSAASAKTTSAPPESVRLTGAHPTRPAWTRSKARRLAASAS